ncbi:MAG TPA: sulfatase-like hydrolase/transferase [Caulobacteraceae bacterium]|jgi:arylsulfatase A-like enzyme|nr:sulfatase-like hydrolase/transferase [Caulobacteraceae bacterium]
MLRRCSRQRGFALVAALCLALAACGSKPHGQGGIGPRLAYDTRPNILVIEVDHLGLQLGAYGDAAAQTPNIDRLAREGVRFDGFYGASGGADAETAALLTGMQPSTIGMVQEWTGAGAWTVVPPPEIRGYPELARAAAYVTFHVGARSDPFGSPGSLWTVDDRAANATWPDAMIGQPFLGVIDLSTVTDAQSGEKKTGLFAKRDDDDKSAKAVPVPAYLPDTPAVRDALKAEYAHVHRVDAQVGLILDRLRAAHVLDHTIVVFLTKSGPVRPRAERTVYDAGVHTPLILRWPDGHGRGTVRHDLISGIDVAPAILHMAGVQPRAWMQGQDRLTGQGASNTYVFTVQNRVDDIYERVFAVRDGRYLYVLNLAPYTQVLSLARARVMADVVAAARKAGKLTPVQASAYADDRGEAELYDLKADPDELNNLAGDPAHAGDVARLAQVLNAFAAEAPDYSTWTARDLGDLFKPGGVTPVTAPPQAVTHGFTVELTSLTPGAAILWRRDANEPWTLYTRPIDLHGPARIEATAVRYGFLESPVADFDLSP